jgi:hypothetical protein
MQLTVLAGDAVRSVAQDFAGRGSAQALWVLFDFLSFCYLPPLKYRVFFLRAARSSANTSASSA